MARKLTVLEILLIVFVLIVLAIDILLFCLILENPETSFTQQCPANVSESERIDCAPGQEVTENICTQQYKCCWKLASNVQVPKCFFPQNWGYKINNDSNDTNKTINYIARLEKRTSPSLFGPDVAVARFTTDFQTSNRFHFKITDFYNARYEVPFENLNETYPADGANYHLEVTNDPFSFKLKRKSNNKVLLDTSIGPLQFSEQFLQLSFRLPSANVYGLGEHVHRQYRHNMNWKTWPIFTSNANFTEDMKNLYGAHTFFLCLEDTSGSSFGVFLMNSNAMEVTLQPAPAITYRTIGGILDFYVFLGNTPEQVVQEYLKVVGRPFMPSYWNLGFQLSRRDYGGIEGLEKVINRTHEAGIPYDVQYFDIDYMNENKVFTTDENNFPDLLSFTDKLHREGLKCVIIMHPGISNDSNYRPYINGTKKGIWIKGNNGSLVGKGYPGWTVFPDYSNPSCIEWWKEEFSAFYKNVKFNGIWTEMDELSSFIPGSDQSCEENILNNPPFLPRSMRPSLNQRTVCMDAEFYEDFHYNLHSVYGYLMTKATDLALKNIFLDKRNFILSRSTFAGSGKFAAHWLGDNAATWDDIRWSIPSILEFNLFGIPLVGANICGYLQNTTEELCRRWMQLGAFYPLARNHNGPGFRDQDPAAFGNDSLLVISSRHYLNIRYTLLPYLYLLFYRAHTFGETVARPLVHEFYQDPETWHIHEQFLWGPGLLITPVLYEGVAQVKAYIPDAIWYDYETGEAIQWRKQLVEMAFTDDRIGLHLRGGYIFPTQKPGLNTEISRKNSLGLIIALDHKREAKGEMYWDDGVSKDAVTKKLYILYEFSVTSNHLKANTIHNNYTSSSNLMFTDIKILGMDKKPDNFTILYNNKSTSISTFIYNASAKVVDIQNITGLDLGTNFSIEWKFTVNDLEKFNCFPEDPNVSQDSCKNRGCLWEETKVPGVPICYYDTIPNYAASNIQYLSTGITMQLTYLPPESIPRLSPSPPSSQGVPPPPAAAVSGPLSAEVSVLNVKVTYHTESMLQFKIYDANRKRYEVPVTLNTPPSPVGSPENCLYDVQIQNNPFGIQIRRKSSNTVIWDSQLPGFTFNDMFLSISTRLPSQYIYGFGETDHTSFRRNMTWSTWGMFALDEPPEYRTNSYGTHPYYMALEEDGSAHGVLLLNSNAMDVTLQPTPALTFRTTGGILDFFMVLGPTPELVTQQYTELIGHPAMVPYWALGFQLGRHGYQSDLEIFNLYNEMIKSQIPYDVQHIDIDYMNRKLDFTLSPNFQNLSLVIEQMKKDGMRFVLILNPAISGNETEYLTFTRGKENNVFIKWSDNSDIIWGKALPELPNVKVNESLDHETQVKLYKAHVAFPDFLRNSTVAWWKKEIRELYTNPREPKKSLKFDGLWIDMNEPSNFVNGSVSGCKNETLNKPPYMPYVAFRNRGLSSKTLCMESQQMLPDGSLVSHYDVHSLYGWSQTRPTYEAVQEVTGQRGVVITGSTFPSSGRWGGHLLGNNISKWDQLKKSIIGMMQFSLFGIPYTGANICGFLGDAEYEMCIRWMQLGAFYPLSRNHNTIRTWRQDPVFWNSTFNNYSREVLQIRYSLLPYFYTLMHNAHVKGSTVIRPLLNEFTDDNNTWVVDDQFMLGPAILISPVLQNDTFEIQAYFPRSRWFDYYTGTIIESAGERILLTTTLDIISLHIRAGYILPWQEPAMNTHLSRQQFMGLTIALDEKGKAEGELFWDDGQSINAYENGKYFLAKFKTESNKLQILTIHNNYLSDLNPLKFGHIKIWGVQPTLVTQVTFTYKNQQLIETNFQSDPNKKELVIQLTDKNISLEKLTEVAWFHGGGPPVFTTSMTSTISTSSLYFTPSTTEDYTFETILTSFASQTTSTVSTGTPSTTTRVSPASTTEAKSTPTASNITTTDTVVTLTPTAITDKTNVTISVTNTTVSTTSAIPTSIINTVTTINTTTNTTIAIEDTNTFSSTMITGSTSATTPIMITPFPSGSTVAVVSTTMNDTTTNTTIRSTTDTIASTTVPNTTVAITYPTPTDIIASTNTTLPKTTISFTSNTTNSTLTDTIASTNTTLPMTTTSFTSATTTHTPNNTITSTNTTLPMTTTAFTTSATTTHTSNDTITSTNTTLPMTTISFTNATTTHTPNGTITSTNTTLPMTTTSFTNATTTHTPNGTITSTNTTLPMTTTSFTNATTTHTPNGTITSTNTTLPMTTTSFTNATTTHTPNGTITSTNTTLPMTTISFTNATTTHTPNGTITSTNTTFPMTTISFTNATTTHTPNGTITSTNTTLPMTTTSFTNATTTHTPNGTITSTNTTLPMTTISFTNATTTHTPNGTITSTNTTFPMTTTSFTNATTTRTPNDIITGTNTTLPMTTTTFTSATTTHTPEDTITSTNTTLPMITTSFATNTTEDTTKTNVT